MCYSGQYVSMFVVVRTSILQINAVGTEDEIFEQVRPVFAAYEVYFPLFIADTFIIV